MYNVKVLREHPNRTIRIIGEKLTELQERIETGADPAADMIDDFAKELGPAFDEVYSDGVIDGQHDYDYLD